MGATEITMLVVLILWMAGMMGLGIVAARTSRDVEGFFLGGRRIGAWVTAISSTASSESGWLVLGCVGEAYLYGAKAVWIPIGCLLGFAFNWFFFAGRLRARARQLGSITIPDFLEDVTRDRTRMIRLIAVVIIFLLMFTYVAAQLTAAGKAFRAIFLWRYEVGVLIGAVATIFYTTVGGYRAVAWTDLFQGLAMAALLVVVPVIALVHVGGPGELFEKIEQTPSQTLYVLEGESAGDYVKRRLDLRHGVVFNPGATEASDAARQVDEAARPRTAALDAPFLTLGAVLVRPRGPATVAVDGDVVRENLPSVRLGEKALPLGSRTALAPGDTLRAKGDRIRFQGKAVDTAGGAAFVFETPDLLRFAPPEVLVFTAGGAVEVCAKEAAPGDALFWLEAAPVFFPGGGGPPHPVEEKVEVGGETLSIAHSHGLTGGKKAGDALGGLAGFTLLAFLVGMLGIGLGYPGSPHVLVRYMAARGEREIRQGRIIAISWGILAQFGAIWMGLSARVLFPAIEDPEFGLMAASKAFLPAVVAGVMLAAAISAMRSTADSQLLVAASSAARDLYQKIFRRGASEKEMMRISRWIVLVMGVAAVGLALSQTRVVFWFVLFSWAGLGAAFGPVMILALFGKRTLSASAAASGMLTGFFVTVAWKLWIKGLIVDAGGPGIYELPPAFFSALLVAWLVGRTTATEKTERQGETGRGGGPSGLGQ